MISVTEAKTIIREQVKVLPEQTVDLDMAGGHILAEDVYATMNMPAFRQSAMDGYAFRFEDLNDARIFDIEGEVPAGVSRAFENLRNKAVRIFTGAPLPEEADTVVMQEKVRVTEGRVEILDNEIQKGENVRAIGSEIKKGELGLAKGTYLSPAGIGFLAGIGRHQVAIVPKPNVTLIVTGKELQRPGVVLEPGQVYESNSFTIKAALHQVGIFNVHTVTADDDLTILQYELKAALQRSDLVLLTGGVSVGDYDFVLQAAALCNIKTVFHKVKQRPGKPLYFGMYETVPVFGLPGNPSSVLTCYYEYVTEALTLLTGRKCTLNSSMHNMLVSYSKKSGFTHFLKGRYTENDVQLLNAQESFRLSSFAMANCLIKIEEDATLSEAGTPVEIHKLF